MYDRFIKVLLKRVSESLDNEDSGIPINYNTSFKRICLDITEETPVKIFENVKEISLKYGYKSRYLQRENIFADDEFLYYIRNEKISLYYDEYNIAGYMEEPYYEVYSYEHKKVKRYLVKDEKELLKDIEKIIKGEEIRWSYY